MALVLELGEPDFVIEMVELFVQSSAHEICEIRGALGRADGATLVGAAHKLKGACLGMFATTMAELAGLIEREGRAGRLEAAGQHVVRLELAFDETAPQMLAAARGLDGAQAPVVFNSA